MPDTLLPLSPPSPALFGDVDHAPLWLWLNLEPHDLHRLEAALLDHLRSPLFPPRLGELPRPGDDAGLLEFATGFAPIASRFGGGPELVMAATRIVAERNGSLARDGALACIEALQLRIHAEARALGDASEPQRLRRYVLTARLAADLWVRHVPGVESGRSLAARLREAAAPPPPPPPLAPPAPPDGIAVLQPFAPPNDRAEWDSYGRLATPLPLRAVGREAAARLHRLAETAPAFAAPLAEIRRTLALAKHAGRATPRLRPILLVGPPGIGKTWFAREVAAALGLPFAALNLGGATDNRCLAGTARGWTGATPAWPITEMARAGAPNPLLFLDELDKAGGQRETNGRAHDTLLTMVEPESAAAWFDECLRTAADLRHAVWIMAANETRGIAPSLLTRLSVHRIAPPPADAFAAVLGSLLGSVARDLGCETGDLPALPAETRDALATGFARHRNLRRLRATLEECLGIAAEEALTRAC